MRRAGGGAITFKQSLAKKTVSSAGIKSQSTPSAATKSGILPGGPQISLLNGSSSLSGANSNGNSSA